MEIGFELKSTKSLHFTPNHSFQMYVARGEEVFNNTVGQDTFDYNGTLFPDTVVAATGRNVVHTYEPDLLSYMGKPTVCAEVDAEDLTGMALWLENNAILSQGELQTYYSLRAVINGKGYPVSLLTTKIRVHWEGRGKYCIYLDSLNSLLK